MSPEEQSELAIWCGGIDAYNYVHHFLENEGFIFETAQLEAYTSAVEAKERERCATEALNMGKCAEVCVFHDGSKQAELDKANARIAQLENWLTLIAETDGTLDEYIAMAAYALADSPDTWLLEHDKDVEIRVLELVNSESKSWMDFPDVVSKLIESRMQR